MPEKTALKSLVKIAKHRWIIERDYEETQAGAGLGPLLKEEVGGDFITTPVCASPHMGFLVAERNRFFPLRPYRSSWDYQPPEPPPDFRPAAGRRVRPERA